MRKESRRMALCGILAGLGAMIMLLGGVIPLATFACPAFACISLIPIREEYGIKWTLATYVVIAVISLMLSPDKESALLFAFLGWYPAAQPAIDRLPQKPARILIKLACFNVACGAMMLLIVYVLDLRYIYQEYLEMGRALLVVYVLLCNVTMLLFDVMLGRMCVLYHKRLRAKLFRGVL